MYIREMDIEADNGAVGRCRRDTLLYYESEEGKCLKFGLHESLLESVATLLPFYNEFNCLLQVTPEVGFNLEGVLDSGTMVEEDEEIMEVAGVMVEMISMEEMSSTIGVAVVGGYQTAEGKDIGELTTQVGE